MGYSVIDILEKVIMLENKIQNNINEAIDLNSKNVNMLNALSKVLKKESDKRVKIFNSIVDENKNKDLAEIDFMSYDKISFLFNEYNQKMMYRKVDNPKEYLIYAKDLALEKYSLLVDIQGRLMNNTQDNFSNTYDVLTELIKNTENQIDTFKKVIN